MADEQIKLNAEEYAKNNLDLLKDQEIEDVMMVFFAGAHSRDEEIEELMKRIAELEDEVVQLENGENY